MWWETTKTHRAPLPSDAIAALDEVPITFTMEIGLFTFSDERGDKLGEELEAYFISNDVFNASIVKIKVDQAELQNVKTPAKLEQILAKHREIKPGNLLIAEWKSLEEDVLVTSDRALFISDKTSSDKIYQVIRSWIVRDYKIRSILGRVKTFDGKQLRHNFPPPSPEYEVLVSVLNPRPDLQSLHWNVKKAIETYLNPFLSEFKDLSEFTLKSQWKYQLELKYESKQIKDDTKVGRHFAMEKDTLPQIITSIERKLGTDVANKPCIHLVVYAPPCKMSPVYVYQSGKRVSNFTFDSFISAKWGGIVIANPSDTVCAAIHEEESNQPQEIYLHSHEVMDFVLYELRKIFELEIEVPLSYASIVSLEQIKPRLWETDMHLRNGAIHLIASASSTLSSLIKLLEDIKNIVIGDHVGAEIHEAYENVVEAKEFLKINDIQNAVRHARKAFVAAEKAFNDPSLLELLYFPEEQKYAIYIPLYLPILIPVIFSLNSIRRFFKKSDDKDKKE
jgi:phosphatidylinositol glycan class S